MSGLINFEDEKEVKQYLDNIGVEFSYQCYREKDPEGKERSALSYTVLKGVMLSKWSIICCPLTGGLNH